MNIYGNRIRVYGALLLFLLAVFLHPSYFMVSVFGSAIAIYFSITLTLLFISFFTNSFKDISKQEKVIFIRTPIFCIALIFMGIFAATSYIWVKSVFFSKYGIVLAFLGVDFWIYYHEAKLRSDKSLGLSS